MVPVEAVAAPIVNDSRLDATPDMAEGSTEALAERRMAHLGYKVVAHGRCQSLHNGLCLP